MARATSNRFAKTQTRTGKSQKVSQAASSSNASGNTNPLFKTERFGQHILKNPLVAQSIVDKANLRSTDVVLEVGPGTGNLSVKVLASTCKSLIAVETDPRMAAELLKRVQGQRSLEKKLTMQVADVIKEPLPFFDVCISNTPYQISSPLVFKLLTARPRPRCSLLMLQLEFAERLVARPGSKAWSRLSANVQLAAQADIVMKVSRNNFRPPPDVESAVVRIVPKEDAWVEEVISGGEFDGMLRILFQRRNRTTRANFLGTKGVVKMLETNWRAAKAQAFEQDDSYTSGAREEDFATKLDTVLSESGMGERRASGMSVEDFLELLNIMHREGIHFA